MTIKTTIERLGHKGDGIAPGPVFVPMALPGEEVVGMADGDRLKDVRIVTPSPDRVRPPCRHFKSCGGCALQHASDGFLARWKQQVVRDALGAHGLEAEISLISISPAQSRRRAVLAGRRTKKRAIIGFHGRASNSLVEIPGCQLLHPDLIETLPALAAITMAGASRKGEMSFAITHSSVGVDVAATGGKELSAGMLAMLADLARKHDLARLSWDGEIIVMRRAPAQTFGPAQVVPPPGAFLQATETGEAALVKAVAGIAEGAKSIVDLFAGCGTFTLPLASQAPVHAVEGSPGMLSALNMGWRHASGLKQITIEARDLFRQPLMAGELSRFDTVVIDPPRAGAHAQVAELAKSKVERVAFVSCNPLTFARDALALAGAGWEIGEVRVVDQFRWSPHIELVADLARN